MPSATPSRFKETSPAPAGKIDEIKPVIERELGIPEFARPAFELTEAMVKAGVWTPREKRKRNRNVIFAEQYLERYDEVHAHQLKAEAAAWSEAMTSTPLNLPYTVVRAIIDEAFPQLVATSIFDAGVVPSNPTRIFYEAFYEAETGVVVNVTDENVTAALGAWVDLDGSQIDPNSVVVTNSGATVTYELSVDYAVDYIEGRIMALTGGAITDSQALLVDYSYQAIRKGENQGIERARSGLRFEDLTLTADRLATDVTQETISFARTAAGYDAVTRTINVLVKQLMRNIDRGLLHMALNQAFTVANNSGGTWDSSIADNEKDFVKKLGVAKVKVLNRYYDPTFILMSATNADLIANSDTFTQAGSRPDADLDEAGFVGRLKALPVFRSTEFTDAFALVGNREIVMYRTHGDMDLRGPFAKYDANGLLVASEQYYLQEYNGHISPIPEKAAFVRIT